MTCTRRDLAWGALALLSTVSFCPGIASPALAPRWDLLCLAAPLLLIGADRPPAVLWLPLASLAWGLSSLLWSADPAGGTDQAVHLLLLVGLAWAATAVTDLRPVAWGLSIGLAVNGLVALLQFLGWDALPQTVPPAGLFLNRNVLAELAAPVLVWFLVRGERWYFLAGPALVLALTMDRTAVVGVAVVLVLALAPSSAVGARWRPFVVALAASCAALAALTYFSPWGVDSLHRHLGTALLVLRDLRSAGTGLGSFAALHPALQYAHSDPLQLLDELGLGAVPLLAFASWVLMDATDPDVIPERCALLCLGVESLFSFPLQLPVTILLAGVLVGRLLRARYYVRGAADGVTDLPGMGRFRREDEPRASGAPGYAGVGGLPI